MAHISTKCHRCGSKPIIHLNYLDKHLCMKCFLRLIGRRVRLSMRKQLVFEPGDKVLVLDDGSAAFQVTRFVVDKLSKALPKVKFVYGKKAKKGFKVIEPGFKIVEPISLDVECIEFLEHMLRGKPIKFRVNPTCNVPQHELEKYCEARGLKFEAQPLDANLLNLLRELQDIRPGALFAMQRLKGRLYEKNRLH